MTQIRKVAVLGAGVMGAQIAAHCVNSGIETLLFDLEAKEGDKNGLVNKAIANLGKLKPAPLGSPDLGRYIQACNYADNLSELTQCDLVIEAIAERLDWKEDLYKKIAPHLGKETCLVSNTSGLSIESLSSVLPEQLQTRFCGVHFFNPPRYMNLVELIPSAHTEPKLLDFLESWLTSMLGKGVVRAKDTPNFIANRIGVFSMLNVLHHTAEFGLTLDEADALTGPLIGRPKSATYRTMDVVGLDTMVHVIHTMQHQLKSDPWHQFFHLPEWLLDMVKQGHLGQKTGQGMYRKNGKVIEVWDVKSGQYKESKASVSAEVMAIMKLANPQEKMEKLQASQDKQAQFLAACFRDLFHYCAYHLASIAENVRDVDLAMRWGFGWKQGPFEIWQLSGLKAMEKAIDSAIQAKTIQVNAPLPTWLDSLHEFYTEKGGFSPQAKTHQPKRKLPVYAKQLLPAQVLDEKNPDYKTLYENPGVRLWLLQDDIAVLSFKSKANTIGQAVLDGMQEAIAYAEKNCQGLIVYQDDASNFSSGADLRGVAELIKANKLDALEAMIAQFQQVAMQLKYSTIPTVAALRGRALGGGCEMMMQCNAVVAAFESWPGLVEVGVGVIPAGGGCKEMALRAAEQSTHCDLMLNLTPLYKSIATATVAGSALEAQNLGYLRTQDSWVMNSEEVLYAALAKVKQMAANNFLPPLKPMFKVAGIEGKAMLQAGLVNWLEGGFISAHDYLIANELAEVITGGQVNQGTLVDENWILVLERKAFVRLAQTKETQARIEFMLTTGKPLRN